MRQFTTAIIAIAGWVIPCAHSMEPADSAGIEQFEREVRPILVARCLECHGAKKQEMGVRFDHARSVRDGGDSGPLIQTEQPASSLLLQVLTHEGDIQMPPDEKLSDAELESIRQWVMNGAPWPDSPETANPLDAYKSHWAFQPIKDSKAPQGSFDRAETWIDPFIIAKLGDQSLTLAKPANRRTLLRRATFDLLGLPPTYEEVEQFQASDQPDAYDRELDRLLASPHYGERWARHWLDVARYADTKGYVFVSERRYPFAYTFRDYVINSFNEDRPYDMFVREQLAADSTVTPSDPSPLAAMGFLTVGRRFLNNGHDIIDDRIDVVTRGLLGLTVTCARCHDHKYDPISTADYYSLYGVFASSNEPDNGPVIGTSTSPERLADYQAQVAAREKEVDQFIAQKRAEKESKLRASLPKLLHTAHEMAGQKDDPKVDALAREIGVHPRLVQKFLSRWQDYLGSRLKPEHPIFGLWALYSALPADSFATASAELSQKLAGASPMAAKIHPAVAQPFRTDPPASMTDVVERYCQIFTAQDEQSQAVRNLLGEADSPFSVSTDDVMGALDQGERNELTDRRNKIVELRVVHDGAPPEAMVLNDNPTPTEPVIFIRGNPARPGDKVPRRFISFLDQPDNPPFQQGSGRRELADHIADPNNPLTARVMVNRLWHWHFSRGLARQTSDFGVRADPPSHPELLDRLAREFIDSGWSIKTLHRNMMTSAVYRQSSADDPQGREKDPENDLLWSFRRRRIDLEEMRDALLFASGELEPDILGRSVNITGENSSHRRAVYAFVDRQNLEGYFRTFDFANPNTSVPARFVTTVPQQALYMFNSSFVENRCEQLVQDPTLSAAPSIEHQINAIYRRLFARPATAEEVSAGRAFIESELVAAPVVQGPAWSYGMGSINRTIGKVEFHHFARFMDQRWQPGVAYPDPRDSHASLTAGGGHPGPDTRRSVIRRWTAPEAMTIQITGVLKHPSDKGDGVAGVIVSSRQGILGEWATQKSAAPTRIDAVEVRAGDTVDFVVEPRSEHSFDSFDWRVKIVTVNRPPEATTAHSVDEALKSTWDSGEEFAGPRTPSNPLKRYVQVLLLTNEFAFVD